MAKTNWSLAYYAPFGVQQGLKVGLDIDLADSKEVLGKSRITFLNPEIAAFYNPRVQDNYLVNFKTGSKADDSKKWQSSWMLGAGYLLSRKWVDGSVNLGTGEVERTKENSSFFLPTINYELVLNRDGKLDPYLGAYFGQAIGKNSSLFFGVELGVNIYSAQAGSN